MIGYFLDRNAGGLQKVNALQSNSFTQKRRITIKKPSLNFMKKVQQQLKMRDRY